MQFKRNNAKNSNQNGVFHESNNDFSNSTKQNAECFVFWRLISGGGCKFYESEFEFGQRLVAKRDSLENSKKIDWLCRNGLHCFTAEILQLQNSSSPESLPATNRRPKSLRNSGYEIANMAEDSAISSGTVSQFA